ncbi:MAG: MGMT family protein [Huintestinicola sp.]
MKEKVYGFLKTVPKGKVVTYGQIAEAVGNPRAARAVGNILNSNPNGDEIPCYKVVDSKGRLSEHYAFGGIEKQKERLEKEGIEVENYRVDLNKYKF